MITFIHIKTFSEIPVMTIHALCFLHFKRINAIIYSNTILFLCHFLSKPSLKIKIIIVKNNKIA